MTDKKALFAGTTEELFDSLAGFTEQSLPIYVEVNGVLHHIVSAELRRPIVADAEAADDSHYVLKAMGAPWV